MENEKRLFFGAEVAAPWQENYPSGRIISEKNRHLTLAFLGHRFPTELLKKMEQFPKPAFKIGPAGKCDQLLFLPKHEPRTVSYHIGWLEEQEALIAFQKTLLNWLYEAGYTVDQRELLSHVTLARAPFDRKEWEKSFIPIPIYIKAIHLYESIGNLHYESRWEYPLIAPFEEFEHTADIAFRIRGQTLDMLYTHAMLALCFSYPAFTPYFTKQTELHSLEDVIAALNQNVAIMDADIGIPFKAVSYHGEIKKDPNNLLEWEMIVDV